MGFRLYGIALEPVESKRSRSCLLRPLTEAGLTDLFDLEGFFDFFQTREQTNVRTHLEGKVWLDGRAR